MYVMKMGKEWWVVDPYSGRLSTHETEYDAQKALIKRRDSERAVMDDYRAKYRASR